MKSKLLVGFLSVLLAAPVSILAQSAAFTYQGRLQDGRRPATGNYDLQFALYTDPVEGAQLGPTLTNAPVTVANGLFTAMLDFGSSLFDGTPLWLEIAVRTNGSAASYTVLQPRQPLTAAPYATFATTAGSVSGSATNPTIYGALTLAGATNVVISTTNRYAVTFSPNTNKVFVAGAGASTANGVYTIQGTAPQLVYTNTHRMRFVHVPDDLDYAWQILDAQAILLYGTPQDDFTDPAQWQVVLSAAAPRPASVSYGTNFLTNYVTQLQIAGAKVPAPSLGNDLYVNAAIGNDLFAQRGRADLAYRTVSAALRAATNNDTVIVAPGVYNETPFVITLPIGVKLIGAGKRVTCIYGHPTRTGNASLELSSSNVLSAFSTDFLISLGGYSRYASYGPATNAFLERIEAFGVGDVIFASSWQGFRAEDCDFIGNSDCFAEFQTDPIGTNAVAELYNCRLKTEGSGAFSSHGLVNGGRGQVRMFGGSIEAKNSASSACVWAPSSAPPGGSIEISGVSLRYGTTNNSGNAYAILNESGANCRITTKGMLVNVADVSGPVWYEGNLYTTNLVNDVNTNAASPR